MQRTAFIAIECHMPTIKTDDGVALHYEETGSGTPVVFVHEFGGDHRSWEPQVRLLLAPLPLHRLQRARLSAFGGAGGLERYSQERARDDIRGVLDGLKIERAHIVGLSMGAFATLHFGMALSRSARFRSPSRAAATARIRRTYRSSSRTRAPTPRLIRARAWRKFVADLRRRADARAVPEQGSARLRRVHAPVQRAFGARARRTRCSACRRGGPRSTTWRSELREADRADADHDRRRGRAVPRGERVHEALHPDGAGLAVLPKSGHGINLEEPALFNQLLERLPPPGGSRALGAARCARGRRLDLRPDGKP